MDKPCYRCKYLEIDTYDLEEIIPYCANPASEYGEFLPTAEEGCRYFEEREEE